MRIPAGLPLVLLLVLGCAQHRVVYAQTGAGTREVVAAAQEEQRQGRFGAAVDLVEGELRGMTDKATREDRLLLAATCGYLYQIEAERNATEAAALRAAAASWYSQVLDEEPNNPAILQNLVLVYAALGDPLKAVEHLEKAITADPTSGGRYALMIGDLYRQNGDGGIALDFYRRAAALASDPETSRSRIVDLHRQGLLQSPAELLTELPEWCLSTPEAAIAGYRFVIEQTFQNQEDHALDAFAGWLDCLSADGRLDVASLSDLPTNWEHRAVADVRAYLAEPWHEPPGDSWLMAPERRALLGQMSLALGRARLFAGHANEAERIWQTGVQMLGDSDPMITALWQELLALYGRRPELDPDGAHSRQIVRRVFGGKGEAYYRADAEAIQRFHTLLGLMYAERRQWTSTEPFANAIFQLEHAISTAERRDEKNKTYQPLGELKLALARGYGALGRTGESRSTYLAAVMGMLDGDAVPDAIDVLDELRALGGPDNARASMVRDLETIARFRLSLSQATGPEQGCETTEAGRIVSGERESSLPVAFLRRQQFKVFADCGRSPEVALLLALDEGVRLASASDVHRLKQAESLVATRMRATASPAVFSGRPVASETDVLTVSLPSTTRSVYVRVNPETALAARLARELGDTKGNLDVRINGSVVTVRDATGAGSPPDSVTRKIKSVRGVSRVETRERKFEPTYPRKPGG